MAAVETAAAAAAAAAAGRQQGTTQPQQTQNICINLYNVGPASKTLGRRCINIIQMFCVCWDIQQ